MDQDAGWPGAAAARVPAPWCRSSGRERAPTAALPAERCRRSSDATGRAARHPASGLARPDRASGRHVPCDDDPVAARPIAPNVPPRSTSRPGRPRRSDGRGRRRRCGCREGAAASVALVSPKTRSPAPEHDRIDHQPQLVDEVVLHQRVHELTAGDDDDVTVQLALEPGDLLDHVAPEHRRVAPARRRSSSTTRRTWAGR